MPSSNNNSNNNANNKKNKKANNRKTSKRKIKTNVREIEEVTKELEHASIELTEFPNLHSLILKKDDNSLLKIEKKETESVRSFNYFHNIVTKAKQFIALYNEVQIATLKRQGEVARQCLSLFFLVKNDSANLFSQEKSAPLPPISRSRNAKVSVLINAMESLIGNDPTLRNLATQVANPNPTATNSNSLLQSFATTIKRQPDNSILKLIKEKKAFLEKMLNIVIAYQETAKPRSDSTNLRMAQKKLAANKTAQAELLNLEKQYAHLPDELPFGSDGEPESLRSHLADHQTIYLESLQRDAKKQEKEIGVFAKKRQEDIQHLQNNYIEFATQTLRSGEYSILMPDATLLIEANTSFQKAKSVEIKLPERKRLLLSAQKEYVTHINGLTETLQQINSKKKLAEAELDIGKYLTNVDEELSEELNQILPPEKEQFINHYFNKNIRLIKKSLEEITSQKLHLDELLLELETALLLEDVAPNNNLTHCQQDILDVEERIKVKNQEIIEFKKNADRLTTTKQTYETDIQTLKTEEIPTQTEEVEEHRRQIKEQKEAMRLFELDTESFAAIKKLIEENLEKIKALRAKKSKTPKEEKDLETLREEVNGLHYMLDEKQNDIQERHAVLKKHTELLATDEPELNYLQEHLIELQTLIPPLTRKIQLFSENHQKAAEQSTLLNGHLFKLKIRAELDELNKKLSPIDQTTIDIQNKKILLEKELNKDPSNLDTIINMHNEAHTLKSKDHFRDIYEFINTIQTKLKEASLSDKDEFKILIESTLKEKIEKLDAEREKIQQAAVEMRHLANQAAAKVAKDINISFEKLKASFKSEILPKVDRLKEVHNDYSGYTKLTEKTLEDEYQSTKKAIGASLKEVDDKLLEVRGKLACTTKILNEEDFTYYLDSDALKTSFLDLKNKQEDLDKEVFDSDTLAKKNLKAQERRNTIKQLYTIILDSYESYRNKKYRLKDFFSSKDKTKRHTYIEKLKGLLLQYQPLNTQSDELQRHLKSGKSQFKSGLFKNKTDSTKSLSGILDKLEKDVAGTPKDKNFLRIPTQPNTLRNSERPNIIKQQYSGILEAYKINRDKKYRVKDFFSDKDKKARTEYITALQTALRDYELSPNNLKDLVDTVDKGLKKFKSGKLSNKEDPTKNLAGILDLLLQDICNPLDNYSYLRISKHLNRELAPIPASKVATP